MAPLAVLVAAFLVLAGIAWRVLGGQSSRPGSVPLSPSPHHAVDANTVARVIAETVRRHFVEAGDILAIMPDGTWKFFKRAMSLNCATAARAALLLECALVIESGKPPVTTYRFQALDVVRKNGSCMLAVKTWPVAYAVVPARGAPRVFVYGL
jgi:hypothetical protein